MNMVCTMCGGMFSGSTGQEPEWVSLSSFALASETGRTCFCGVSSDEMIVIVESFQTNLEKFLVSHFPGQSLKQIRASVADLPSQSTLRVHVSKRLRYFDFIKEKLKELKALEPSISAGSPEFQESLSLSDLMSIPKK